MERGNGVRVGVCHIGTDVTHPEPVNKGFKPLVQAQIAVQLRKSRKSIFEVTVVAGCRVHV